MQHSIFGWLADWRWNHHATYQTPSLIALSEGWYNRQHCTTMSLHWWPPESVTLLAVLQLQQSVLRQEELTGWPCSFFPQQCALGNHWEDTHPTASTHHAGDRGHLKHWILATPSHSHHLTRFDCKAYWPVKAHSNQWINRLFPCNISYSICTSRHKLCLSCEIRFVASLQSRTFYLSHKLGTTQPNDSNILYTIHPEMRWKEMWVNTWSLRAKLSRKFIKPWGK